MYILHPQYISMPTFEELKSHMCLEAALWNKTSLECSQTFWTRCFKPSLECKQMAAPPLSLKWIRTSSTTTTSLSSWESVQTVGGYVVSSIVASAPPFQAVGSGQIGSACFSPTVSHLTHVDALNQTVLPRPGGGKTELSGYLHQNTQTPNRFCCSVKLSLTL